MSPTPSPKSVQLSNWPKQLLLAPLRTFACPIGLLMLPAICQATLPPAPAIPGPVTLDEVRVDGTTVWTPSTSDVLNIQKETCEVIMLECDASDADCVGGGGSDWDVVTGEWSGPGDFCPASRGGLCVYWASGAVAGSKCLTVTANDVTGDPNSLTPDPANPAGEDAATITLRVIEVLSIEYTDLTVSGVMLGGSFFVEAVSNPWQTWAGPPPGPPTDASHNYEFSDLQWEERHYDGTGTWSAWSPLSDTDPALEMTPTEPGYYEYRARNGNCDSWKTRSSVCVLDLSLEPIAAENDPELEFGRICINAQPEYERAKWKAFVRPGTATVTTVSGGVSVTDGASLGHGDTFWVEGGSACGPYQIQIAHDTLGLFAPITAGENVFKFRFAPLTSSSATPVQTKGNGAFNPTTNSVSASSPTAGVLNGAVGSQNFLLKVIPHPDPSLFSGTVLAEPCVTLAALGGVTLEKGEWEDGITIGVGVNLGVVSASVSGGGSKQVAIFAADLGVSFNGGPEVELGKGTSADPDYSFSTANFNVPAPLAYVKKTEPISLSGLVADEEREFEVGVTQIPMRTSIGCAAKSTSGPVDPPLPTKGACILSPSGITAYPPSVKDYDDVFEIQEIQ